MADVIDPLRYPQGGVTNADLTAVRRLKARMENERLPMGVRPDRHLKLGPGGLSDAEWTVQLLQLRHAGQSPDLRTTGTLAALDAEEEAGLLSTDDADVLRRTWTLVTAVRNACYLWQPGVTRADVLPDSVQDLTGVAACMPPGLSWGDGQARDGADGQDRVGADARGGQELSNAVLALMRRSRRIMTRLFYGYDD